MLPLGESAVSNEARTACARFSEKTVTELFSRAAADNDVSECFDAWSKWDTFVNAVVKRIVCNPFFIRRVAALIKLHVISATDEFCLAQLYAETENVKKTGVSLLRDKLSSDPTKKSKNTLKLEGSKHQSSEQETRSSRRSRSPKKI